MPLFSPRCLSSVFCIFLLAAPAAAQTVSAPLSQYSRQQGQPSRALNPYDAKLNRMAEILGSLHYLYNLCAPKTAAHEPAAQWRDYMQKLPGALRSDSKQTGRLYASFNRSYQAFADNYGSCTVAAREALARYRLEGQNLSRALLENYGSDF